MEWEKLFKPRTLERGRDYAKEGKVAQIKRKCNTVSASVEGWETYKVVITYDESNQIAEMSCTCPSHTKTNYCKHCAALLFATDDSTIDDTSGVAACESSITVKSTLPRSASAEDKLNEIINTLERVLGVRQSTKQPKELINKLKKASSPKGIFDAFKR